jgi:TetR/AcrR family transcriptional regulator, copper-responsive repressor
VQASLIVVNLEQATGVNKSGLYPEFEDKEDLFVQSLQYSLESLGKKGLLTTEPLGWNNIERFLKMVTTVRFDLYK